MESIAVRNLSFRYPGAAKDTLRGVDFHLDAGDFTVLIGATGNGKSTLLRLLIGPLAATSPRSFACSSAPPAAGKSTLLRLLKPKLAPPGMRGSEIRAAGYSCYVLSDLCCWKRAAH